jgi:TolB-like protein
VKPVKILLASQGLVLFKFSRERVNVGGGGSAERFEEEKEMISIVGRRHIPFLMLIVFSLLLSPITVLGQQNELRSSATALAGDIAAAGKKAVAVVDFTDLQGNPIELGRYLAEEFSVFLTRARKDFDVIDRTHLKTILAEHKLATTGVIDPATARKMGQIIGADVLLTGTITPFSESVHVAIKLLATDTARLVGADTIDLPKIATIAELLKKPGDTPLVAPTNKTSGPGVPAGNPQVNPRALQSNSEVLAPTYGQNVSQGNGLNVTATQMIVASSALSLTLSITFENTTREDVHFAFVGPQVQGSGPADPPYTTRASTTLDDDRGNAWRLTSLVGAPVLPGGRGRPQDYTVIAGGGRITVLMTLNRPNVNVIYDSNTGTRAASPAGETFTFGAQAAVYGASGPRILPIGLSGIRPVR